MGTSEFVGKNQTEIDNVRPSVIQAGLTMIETEFYTWLQSRGAQHRNTPIYLDSLSEIKSSWKYPIVASRAMCNPPSVDGGYTKYSPTALLRDKWHDLVVTAGETKSFTSGSPTQTLTVSAIDRNIPKGFVIGFPGGYLQLTSSVVQGATTLSLTRINSDVTVANADQANSANGYFYQQGCGSPTVSDLSIVGNPYPVMNQNPRQYEFDRKYACDGIFCSANGGRYENLLITNFPGHGLFVSNPMNTDLLSTNVIMPQDRFECSLGFISAYQCLTGITLQASDSTYETLIAAACRDYGVLLYGPNTQGKSIHSYGCGIGTWIKYPTKGPTIEGENCNFGLILDAVSGQYDSGGSQINSFFGHDNTYFGLGVLSDNVHINSILSTHSGVAISNRFNAAGMYDGWNMSLGSWADGFVCPALRLLCSGGAYGLNIGHNGTKVATDTRIAGKITGDGTAAIGFQSRFSMSGFVLDLCVAGFGGGEVYFGDACTLAGNTIHFRGPSTSKVRWPNDNTTYGFNDPHIPSGLETQIQFHVY